MATFFLLIIYLAFISLGLPDSLLGSAWTVMRLDFNVPLGWAGIISVTISGGTILSSLISERIIKRFGTGKVTFSSVLATAIALLGFSLSPSFFWLIVCSIPLGLGAGSIDAGLNNYVAVHYKPHHMSWLHCFWGIGATLGPIIMAQNILRSNNWSGGYFMISMIQFGLVALLFFTLPLLKRIPNSRNTDSTVNLVEPAQNGKAPEQTAKDSKLTAKDSELTAKDSELTAKSLEPIIKNPGITTVGPVFAIKGVKLSLIAFLFYCGTELTVGLWGSSYLVQIKEIAPVTAARWIAMYYAGITVGRLITGFLTMKISCRRLIQAGQIITLGGVLLLLLPSVAAFPLAGFILIGLGCAPIFPCMLHETPDRFGPSLSQKIMGLQMAFAYIGSTFLPPLLGLVISLTDIGILPFFLVVYIIGMYLSSERIVQLMRERREQCT
jgi:fucose permease